MISDVLNVKNTTRRPRRYVRTLFDKKKNALNLKFENEKCYLNELYLK